jgi:hypothetical protein
MARAVLFDWQGERSLATEFNLPDKGQGMRFIALVVFGGLLLCWSGCSPKFNHRVGVAQVFKTVPEQQKIELDGTPEAAFADEYLQVSVYESEGSLGLRLKNVAGRPIALLQDQIVTLDQNGLRHELLSAGMMMPDVVAVPKEGGYREVFPLHRFTIKQAGSTRVTVLLPVMIEGIYHEYHLNLKVQSSQQ